MLGVVRVETATREVWLMPVQVKMPGKSKNNIFKDKEIPNKATLMFLDAKVLTES